MIFFFFFTFCAAFLRYPAYELKHTLNIVDDDDRTSSLKSVSLEEEYIKIDLFLYVSCTS